MFKQKDQTFENFSYLNNKYTIYRVSYTLHSRITNTLTIDTYLQTSDGVDQSIERHKKV